MAKLGVSCGLCVVVEIGLGPGESSSEELGDGPVSVVPPSEELGDGPVSVVPPSDELGDNVDIELGDNVEIELGDGVGATELGDGIVTELGELMCVDIFV